MENKTWKLAKSIALPLIGGTIAGLLATRSAQDQYQDLVKPKVSPPSWVFPVAWTTLYTTMGIAKYQFDQTPKSKSLNQKGNLAYQTQLGFNFLWSFLFFKWNKRGSALVEAAGLWSAVGLNTYYFYQAKKSAGALLFPYVGWTTFAVYLNYATWEKNRDRV